MDVAYLISYSEAMPVLLSSPGAVHVSVALLVAADDTVKSAISAGSVSSAVVELAILDNPDQLGI